MTEIAADVVLFVAGLVAGNLLPAYFRKKGENLATKEDIGEITNKIEAVKSKISRNNFRYQAEFNLLRDLAGSVVDFRDASRGLRPVADLHGGGETAEERKERRLNKYFETGRALYETYEHNKPFYSQQVYDGVEKLIDVASWEAIQYQHESPRDSGTDYWQAASESADKIEAASNEVLDTIRERVKGWNSL